MILRYCLITSNLICYLLCLSPCQKCLHYDYACYQLQTSCDVSEWDYTNVYEGFEK